MVFTYDIDVKVIINHGVKIVPKVINRSADKQENQEMRKLVPGVKSMKIIAAERAKQQHVFSLAMSQVGRDFPQL